MAEITAGGKGSSLSSSSIYAITNGLAQVRIDTSALNRLPSSSSSPLNTHSLVSLLPSLPTIEESRAALVVLLGKFLSPTGSPLTRTVVPVRIAEALNSRASELGTLDLTDDEALSLEKLKLSAALCGICALLDHQSSALSRVSDAVAAISCEALKADVLSFNSVDSGDGYAAKEEIGVASDLKVLLNGSKLVGKVELEGVSRIPEIHASLREQVKSMHSKMRVELNSSRKVVRSRAVRTALTSLASALWDLGYFSLSRTKMNVDAVGSEDLRSSLVALFEKKCPNGEALESGFNLVSKLGLEKEDNYEKVAHEVYVLMEIVRKIVNWEAITAFVALEGAELNGKKSEGGEVNGGGDAKAEKKKNEKKKKVVLGKGSSVIVQLIKERLLGKGNSEGSLGLLESLVEEISSFLDPKDPGFDNLMNTVKEIVESNETRRLPKLPKVMAYMDSC